MAPTTVRRAPESRSSGPGAGAFGSSGYTPTRSIGSFLTADSKITFNGRSNYAPRARPARWRPAPDLQDVSMDVDGATSARGELGVNQPSWRGPRTAFHYTLARIDWPLPRLASHGGQACGLR